jgi:hypothetical protein
MGITLVESLKKNNACCIEPIMNQTNQEKGFRPVVSIRKKLFPVSRQQVFQQSSGKN